MHGVGAAEPTTSTMNAFDSKLRKTSNTSTDYPQLDLMNAIRNVDLRKKVKNAFLKKCL